MKYTTEAKLFVDAIREIAEKPENLDNLESYLAHHFDFWLEKMAHSPIDLAVEMHCFADMDI